jgi:starch synthase
MYSLRYGTVPVVRRTGGLDDTVENWNPRTRRGTGFTFKDYTPDGMVAALRSALDLYGDPSAWRSLQLSGMSKDHSWDASAIAYGRVYERAIRLGARPTRLPGRAPAGLETNRNKSESQ